MRGVAGGILHVDFSDLGKRSRLVRRSLPPPLSGSHIARFCPRRDRFRDEVPNSAAASNEARVGRLASPRALPKSTANRGDSGTKTEVSHEEKPIWMRAGRGRARDLGLLIGHITRPAIDPQTGLILVGYLGFCARIFLLGCTFLEKHEQAAGKALSMRWAGIAFPWCPFDKSARGPPRL